MHVLKQVSCVTNPNVHLKVVSFLYADDTTLIVETVEELQRELDK